jgi:hypothetical protein
LIGHVKGSLRSIDLFRCESILLRSHWALVMMDALTRRIVGFGVDGASIDGVSECRMFNRGTAGNLPPRHLSTDHDPLFGFHRWLANLRVREIEKVKSSPYAPVSHPLAERLIGTIRRETWTAPSSGTRSTWHESWSHSEITKAANVFTARSGDPRRAARRRALPCSRYTGSLGLATALPASVSDPGRCLTTI